VTYFVKIPAKFRRGNAASRRMAPVWSFSTEVEAIDFAKTFEICWVEVSVDNKVIFRNYSTDTKWMSEAQATAMREQTLETQDKAPLVPSRVRRKQRGAV